MFCGTLSPGAGYYRSQPNSQSGLRVTVATAPRLAWMLMVNCVVPGSGQCMPCPVGGAEDAQAEGWNTQHSTSYCRKEGFCLFPSASHCNIRNRLHSCRCRGSEVGLRYGRWLQSHPQPRLLRPSSMETCWSPAQPIPSLALRQDWNWCTPSEETAS